MNLFFQLGLLDILKSIEDDFIHTHPIYQEFLENDKKIHQVNVISNCWLMKS